MSKYTEEDLKVELENKEYEYGFYTNLDSETFPIGLNEDIVRAISKKKDEPEWMTDWRIEAFRAWQEMIEPEWANVHYEKPDFQAISYYSAPKKADPNKTLDDELTGKYLHHLHLFINDNRFVLTASSSSFSSSSLRTCAF